MATTVIPTSLLSTDRMQRRRVRSSQDHPAGVRRCSGKRLWVSTTGWSSKGQKMFPVSSAADKLMAHKLQHVFKLFSVLYCTVQLQIED